MDISKLGDISFEESGSFITMDDVREMSEIGRPTRSITVLTKPKPAHTEVSTTDGKAKPEQRKRSSSVETPSKPGSVQTLDDLETAHADLKKEVKILSRENREQSLELRAVKRENAQIREAYTNLKSETSSESRKFTKSERAKFIEHFEMLEQQALYFQHEYRKRDAHLDYLTKQTREANQEKETADDEIRHLQQKIRDLSTNLTECRDDLLRLQPPSQMSDSEVGELYSNLCQQIAGWVDDQTEDPDNLEEYFERLHGVNDLPKSFRNDINNRVLKLAKQSPSCLPLLLQYLIHCRIQEEMLGLQVFVYGLDESNTLFIQGVEEGLTELEPKRDETTLRRWRSETLQGLLKMEAFAEEQRRVAEDFSRKFARILSPLLLKPSTSSQKASESGTEATSAKAELDWQDLHKRITQPAITLSNTFRVSTTNYEFFSHVFSRPPAQPMFVHHREIQHYQMIDTATSKIIRPDSNLKIADSGKIGDEMFVVASGLLRSRQHDGGRDKAVLCKPTVLVKLDEPMGKRGKKLGAGGGAGGGGMSGIKGLSGWAPNWFGGSAGGNGSGTAISNVAAHGAGSTGDEIDVASNEDVGEKS